MRTRPLARRDGKYWRVYVGDSRYCLPDYYTRMHTAMDAARNIRPARKGTP